MSGTRAHQILGNMQKEKRGTEQRIAELEEIFEEMDRIVALFEEKATKEKPDKKNSIKTHILSVGDFFCYCSKPSLTVTDKVGRIVSVTKECVCIDIEGWKKIMRQRNNFKLHETLNKQNN